VDQRVKSALHFHFGPPEIVGADITLWSFLLCQGRFEDYEKGSEANLGKIELTIIKLALDVTITF